MDVEAFYPQIRWELALIGLHKLSTENVLGTQMLDTLVPSIERHINSTSAFLEDFNTGISNLLPLSRRAEVTDFEKDLRVEHSMLWTAIADYALPAIEEFLGESTKLFDIADAQALPAGQSLTQYLASLRRKSSLAASRCNQVNTRLQSMGSSWSSFHKIIEAFAMKPIPGETGFSLVGQFMEFVLQQGPLHSSREEYDRLLTSSRHLAEECASLHGTLESLADFFQKVVKQYDEAGQNPAWSSRLDFHDLGQRWRRLHNQVAQCQQVIPKQQAALAKLQPPFFFHDNNVFMDEILGPTRLTEIYVIVEELSSLLQQIPRHIRDFCRNLRNYPDESLRVGLATMVREARLRGALRLEFDMQDILPYRYLETIESWLHDVSEDEAQNSIKYWADRAEWQGDACRLASNAVGRSLEEWRIIDQWTRDVEARQKRQEEERSRGLWLTWPFGPQQRNSLSTTNLREQLTPILRSIDRLREIIDSLAAFWENLSQDIRAIPRESLAATRTAIISSGLGGELIEQWRSVSELMRNTRIARDQAGSLIRIAPPGIRSTQSG
ncbi:hypothetical protein FRB90_011701 [Tulasnella sp. 427]|nr:hypothetical protein FRB90_011701 [Tulasnella sp. 427]